MKAQNYINISNRSLFDILNTLLFTRNIRVDNFNDYFNAIFKVTKFTRIQTPNRFSVNK